MLFPRSVLGTGLNTNGRILVGEFGTHGLGPPFPPSSNCVLSQAYIPEILLVLLAVPGYGSYPPSAHLLDGKTSRYLAEKNEPL